MDNQNVKQLLQIRQNKFIETRTNIENEVNRFLTSLIELDDGTKARLNVKEGITCKDLLPSLWVEPFNEAQYQLELNALKTYISQVTAVCDEINQEALACLQS